MKRIREILTKMVVLHSKRIQLEHLPLPRCAKHMPTPTPATGAASCFNPLAASVFIKDTAVASASPSPPRLWFCFFSPLLSWTPLCLLCRCYYKVPQSEGNCCEGCLIPAPAEEPIDCMCAQCLRAIAATTATTTPVTATVATTTPFPTTTATMSSSSFTTTTTTTET